MLFSEFDRVLYRDNPLVEVICQFRFPTILRIREGKLADFQDGVRKDYPLYTEQKPSFDLSSQVPRELAAIIERINIPMPAGLVTHRFSTKDSGRFISVSDEFMALAQTKYERWEAFRDEIVKAESALRRVYEPAFYSRVGLRYRDVISRKRLGFPDAPWRELLKPHIVAELGDPEVSASIASIRTRTVIKIPDIAGAQVTLIHGLATQPQVDDEECYVIDADFSVDRKEGLDEPLEILDKFNRLAGRLFRWAIEERLHSAMGPKPI
ncbi:MAG: TIGR04255 family protein [Chloroflexota bacterium]